MNNSFVIGKNIAGQEAVLLTNKANRHGLIAGATGTGKTITLKAMAENFAEQGVSVFLADVKGDLTGFCEPGQPTQKLQELCQQRQLEMPQFQAYAVNFWDIYAEQGIAVKTTVSEFGPLLLSRVLNLNLTQSSILTILFKIADDEGLFLDNLDDLRALIGWAGENSKALRQEYGNLNPASLSTMARNLLELEHIGGDKFFGEPGLNLADMISISQGQGMINVLKADRLIQNPKLYSTFLLWMLSELFEDLPEVGDLDKPKMVFFFDEAHLLFDDAPEALVDKILQVVRLIRSKGIGIYFVTQNPIDIPDNVLGQLGNRIQHALRSFTPKEQQAIKKTAQTYRQNPNLYTEEVVTQLENGEALISFLDDNGSPTIVDRYYVLPPRSLFGPANQQTVENSIKSSTLYTKYNQDYNDRSAYEILQERSLQQKNLEVLEPESNKESKSSTSRSNTKKPESMITTFIKSTLRSIGYQVGREIARGVLGSIKKK